VIVASGGTRSPSIDASEVAPPAPAELTDIAALLHRHGNAMLARDEPRWVADLDRTAAAAEFSTRQRAEFAQAGGVPLSAWTYRLAEPIADRRTLASAAGRLRARVVVARVVFSYALALDPAPSSRDLWLTFVRRDGRFRLAADSDAASTGRSSWRGPWDFGPIRVEARPHALVLAHPRQEADEAAVADLAEAAVPAVSRIWGPGWAQRVVVLIADTPAEFRALSGERSDVTGLAAASTADQVRSDGVVLGARIVLDAAQFEPLSEAGQRLVVRHELTHIAARAVTDDRMPRWVIEGFADYVGWTDSGLPTRTIAPDETALVGRGVLPTALPGDSAFDSPSGAQLAYQQAWLACTFIAARIGPAGLVRFYRAVSTDAVHDPGAAATSALSAVIGMTGPQFVAMWQRYLPAALR
jgi:hypothetical protein